MTARHAPDRPAVSVVIATRNYGRYLPAALESVLAQTHADFEVVVIDDGSTDDTPAAVRPFLTDRRVRYVPVENQGQPGAKNLGVGLSRAPLVAFLDGDDAWEPTKLARQVARMAADPSCDVVCTGRSLLKPDGSLAPADDRLPPPERAYAEMFLTNFICFSSVMVRRSAFERLGRFDTGIDLAIDFDLWTRFLRHCKVTVVPEPLVRYRVGHANLSSRILDRVTTVEGLMHRAFWRRGHAKALPPRHRGLAYSQLYRQAAILERFFSLGRGLSLAARALAHSPLNPWAWHTLGFVTLTALSGAVRSALRRGPAGWSAAYRKPINDPRNV
jgi:glycosyltransferase involved in cell wall biosynthesis